MKHTIRNAALSALLLLMGSIAGCGSAGADSETWLIVVADDTLSVGDLGEAWNRIDERQKHIFLEKENTVGEFIVTYGRKLLLQKELETAGYLSDPGLLLLADARVSEQAGEEMRRLMYEEQEAGVLQDDIDLLLGYLGRMAFFTMDPGTETEISYGPVHMPSLPDDMIGLLDSLEIGSTGISVEGLALRLDSIGTVDSAVMATMTADSAALRANITSSIARVRFENEYEDLRSSLMEGHSLSLDSAVLEDIAAHFAVDSPLPGPGTVIMESDIGSWTVDDLMKELAYYRSRYTIDPADREWLITLLELCQYNDYSLSVMQARHPEILDSLAAERESYLLDIAAEQFYDDRIESMVTVTQEDMRELFHSLEEPLTVPEKRVLHAVRMSRDSSGIFLGLAEEDRDGFIARMEGFENLAADSEHAQITRPLGITEVPGFHGEEVFSIDPADTVNWLGPLDLYGSGSVCMFRLVEVMPERAATFEEVEDRIRMMTRNRLEEQATVNEMRQLEDRYGMTVNEGILNRLPEDPALWVSL